MEWHAIIKAFFNGLAEEEQSFIGFANTHLYEDFSAFHFSLGLTAATAGERVDVLSFTPMDIHEIQAAEEEAKIYDETNVLTPKDTHKKQASKKVQPPTSLPDLINML
jgi:hypothetical protein